MPTWCLLLLLSVLDLSSGNQQQTFQLQVGPAHPKTREETCNKSRVGLCVSSNLNNKTSRRILVNWWVPSAKPEDTISVYLTDPNVNLTSPVFTFFPSSEQGWTETPLRETYVDYRNTFSPICLGFWAVYWRGQIKIASSCLQTNPSWMSDYRQSIGRLRLNELFLPGTHNSAAYSVSYRPKDQNRIDKYVFTQGEPVLSQLLNGVRSLDLRVGHNKRGFFAYHDFVELRHFQGIIDDLVVFLNNSNDIVIMDLHRFPIGFKTQEVHMAFVKYLEDELSSYMVSPALSWHASLEDIWKTGKHLIVSYNNRDIVSKNMHNLWSPVDQKWGDVRTVKALRSYLEPIIKSPPVGAWAAMAELTPNKWDVLFDPLGGLRAMAADTNIHVSEWFRSDWGLHCNIVAIDFFRSSDIVDIAITWNLLKAYNLCS